MNTLLLRARTDSTRALPGSAVTQANVVPLLQAARNNGMFSLLSESDVEIVLSICHFSFVEKDVQLFGVGDQADYLLFIVDGRVNVWCNSTDNQALHVGTASIGAILGESAITSISQRSASVTTVSRCALGYLFYEDFNRLCISHPESALRFLVMMFNQVAERMRAMVSQLTEASQVRAAAQMSLELLSKVLFDRRIGAVRPAVDGIPQAERRGQAAKADFGTEVRDQTAVLRSILGVAETARPDAARVAPAPPSAQTANPKSTVASPGAVAASVQPGKTRIVPSQSLVPTGDPKAPVASPGAAAASARPGEARVAPAPPLAPAPPAAAFVPATGGLLAQLRQAALAKQMEEQKPDPKALAIPRVSRAVEKAFLYLKELAVQLNLTKPAYAKDYTIVGVPKFDGLHWEDAQIDFRTRELSPITKVYERLTLQFRLSANKQLRVTRDSPADERLKQMLLDTKIGFTTQQERSERGSVVRTTFVLACEVRASLELVGNFDTGRLLLRTRNIEHFGLLEHILFPEAITDGSLDELTAFILGKSSRIGPLLLNSLC